MLEERVPSSECMLSLAAPRFLPGAPATGAFSEQQGVSLEESKPLLIAQVGSSQPEMGKEATREGTTALRTL